MTYLDTADKEIRAEQNRFHKNQQKEIHRPQKKRFVQCDNNNKKKPQQKRTFVAKGHDRVISAVQLEKLPVKIWASIWDTPVVGTIIGRDRFTITVSEANKSNQLLLFKSAIVAIEYPKKETARAE